jgi:hypothetical protein
MLEHAGVAAAMVMAVVVRGEAAEEAAGEAAAGPGFAGFGAGAVPAVVSMEHRWSLLGCAGARRSRRNAIYRICRRESRYIENTLFR